MGRRRWFDRKISEQILRRGTMRYADEDASHFREPAPAVNDRVQQAAKKVGAHYVRWNDLLCPAEKCFAVHGGHLLYRDRVHFSLAGAEFFVP
jgi:hypothetical protein